MDRRDDLFRSVIKKDGNAVRCPHSDRHSPEGGHESVISLQIFSRQEGRVHDRYFPVMDLVTLYDMVGEDGVPPC